MLTGIASRPWLIVPTCAAAHATCAIGLLLNPKVGDITALHLMRELLAYAGMRGVLWFVLLAVAVASLVPMAVRMRADFVHLWLWPQQLILFLSTLSILQASWLGEYPDGVPRWPESIFSDQCLWVYVMVAHFAATLRNARYR